MTLEFAFDVCCSRCVDRVIVSKCYNRYRDFVSTINMYLHPMKNDILILFVLNFHWTKPWFLFLPEIPINMHIRGCFIVEQTLKGGCYSDKSIIDQQRGVFSGLLSILSSAEITDFDGKLCINTPSNLDAWKNYAPTKDGLSPFLVCLCILTVMSIKQIFWFVFIVSACVFVILYVSWCLNQVYICRCMQ